jgi:branched-subunit amino acid aminotransferase/4-amino-4-deoxychorismate lyase
VDSGKPIFDPLGELSNSITRVSYHNGQWVEGRRVRISVGDPAVTQAVTAVERLRAYGGVLFQRDRHLDRWERTVSELLIVGLPSRSQLSSLLDEVVRRNQAWIEGQNAFGVVMFASPGINDEPTLVIEIYSIDSVLVTARIERGTPIVVTGVQQPSAASWSRNIKVRCRLHYYLADREARDVDPDAIGILVDSDATVTESSIANLVIVQGSRLVAPPSDQVLCGVSLQVVRDLADQLGIDWTEERITPERLRRAEEVLLTGTSCGLWFANSIDGSESRVAGPVYQKLRSAFDDFVAGETAF